MLEALRGSRDSALQAALCRASQPVFGLQTIAEGILAIQSLLCGTDVCALDSTDLHIG